MLSPEDLTHMQNIGYGGLLRTVTPDDVAERLISQGYARPTAAGTLLLTGEGYKAIDKVPGFIEIGKK